MHCQLIVVCEICCPCLLLIYCIHNVLGWSLIMYWTCYLKFCWVLVLRPVVTWMWFYRMLQLAWSWQILKLPLTMSSACFSLWFGSLMYNVLWSCVGMGGVCILWCLSSLQHCGSTVGRLGYAFCRYDSTTLLHGCYAHGFLVFMQVCIYFVWLTCDCTCGHTSRLQFGTLTSLGYLRWQGFMFNQ